MQTEDFLKCLSCGKKLTGIKKEEYKYCKDCIIKLDFKEKDFDREKIDRSLQMILN